MRYRNRSPISPDIDAAADADGGGPRVMTAEAEAPRRSSAADASPRSRSLEQSMSMSMSMSTSMSMFETETVELNANGDVNYLNYTNDDKKSIFPEWNWDHVRTWVPIRRADRYHPDQINALSGQDVVMLEKFNGHEYYGSVEKGSLEAARKIKSINSKVKILFYLNAMVHYAGYSANDYFKEEWLMMDPITNTPYMWRGKFTSYNHTNVDFRKWWIQRALDMVTNDEIDGIFIDGLCKVNRIDLPEQRNGDSYLETARQLRESLPPGKLLIGNTLRAYGFPDGNVKNMSESEQSWRLF
jgi:hypothetical protein